jgi:hypothetical protein
MQKFYTSLLILFACLSYSVQNALAHEENAKPQEDSLAVGLAFDTQGSLWRASVKNGLILVDSSRDLGKTFSSPVQITPNAQQISSEGELRPKIAISPEGNIYLIWTEVLKKPFEGYIWFSRSINGGKSFEKPYIMHSDRAEIPHRFNALNVSASGKITVIWIDLSEFIAAKGAGKPYEGATIYYATSIDQGASFAPEQKLTDSSCECCGIALTNKPDGAVVAMWRHVFEGGECDYMMAEIPAQPNQAPALKRATFGRWKIDGCPHYGAALAPGGEGKDWLGYHMAWNDGGSANSGKDASLFYGRMDGEAWVSSPPKKFGNHENQAGHPALLSLGENVWLVWLELEIKNFAKQNVIKGMFSDDGGRSWSETKELASSSLDKADYPLLLAYGNQGYLVWNTGKEGLKVIPL